MKSFMGHSRFIQPRRFESATRDTHGARIFDEANTEKIANVSNSSPDCVASKLSKESIADILCNLEQMYDRSISKWDNIRKIDELEHATMRGLPFLTSEMSIKSSDMLQVHETNEVTDVVGEHDDLPTANNRAFINTKDGLISESEQMLVTGRATIFDMKNFVALTLLLLFLLRASYTQRIST
jgi:hypothetical protein